MEALDLYVKLFGLKLDTLSEEYKQFCLAIYLIKKAKANDNKEKRLTKLEQIFNSGYLTKEQGRKLWTMIHSKKSF